MSRHYALVSRSSYLVVIIHAVLYFSYLWWTDWGKEPKIEKAYLDGSNRQIVIDRDIGWPNGIVVDSDEKIFWCDAKLNRIEYAYFDGVGRGILIENIPHPFGISILGNYLISKQ